MADPFTKGYDTNKKRGFMLRLIDAHELKIHGGFLKFLSKSLGGIKAFRKNCQGGSTYFGFYCIFINKFFKNLPGAHKANIHGCFVHKWHKALQLVA
jgi:hypothetical protein